MGQPARRPVDYRDLLDLPDNQVGEIVAGDLYASPRPRTGHAFAQSGVAGVLPRGGRGVDDADGWWILPEVELHLDGNVLVPDLAGWRRSTLPDLPDTAAMTVRPDWVCEILSPSTHRWDRFRKLPVYAALGVGHAWLLDPDARTVEVLRNQSGQWLWIANHTGEGDARFEPFDHLTLDVGRWWLPAPSTG